MVPGESGWSWGREPAGTAFDGDPAFAGELFLTLAAEGRLVVDQAQADEMIGDLQRTLELITARLGVLRTWQQLSAPVVDDLDPNVAQSVVDTVFVDQLAPGQLERAVLELPKYIQALTVARRLLPSRES